MLIEKMHGCGNDFCVLSYEKGIDYSNLAIKLCNRKTGIGSDGMIVVKTNPLEMLFYNSDGSRAPMCGNGIRCFSKYALEHNLVKRSKFDVLTGAGKLTIEVTQEEPFMCKVNMGSPIFNNSVIRVSDGLDCFGRVINVDDLNITVYSFFMGTIHTVIFVDSFEDEILKHALNISKHKLFNECTNVNFVKIIDKHKIKVKTFERGVYDWTLACGTGCCASVVCANKLGLCYQNVEVELELGSLEIEIKKSQVFMTGPAIKVFECEIEEDKLC